MRDLILGLLIAIVVIAIIGLLEAIGNYIDEKRQAEVQEAWEKYSADMELDKEIQSVVAFARKYQLSKGWREMYLPLIRIDTNETEEDGV